MARFSIPNMAYIRGDDQKYYSALQAIQGAINNHSDQGNLDPASGQVAAPPSVSSINVVEKGGIHDIQIIDQSPAYAGVQYGVEYSQTPDFQNPHMIDMGTSQNHRANLGPGKFYWRASSSYHPASPSDHVYHGGVTPQPVGSGDYSGPPMQQGQGFTGPYRNSTTPPIRK
jgi:hypothetical protein